MLRLFKGLVARKSTAAPQAPAPDRVEWPGLAPFVFKDHLGSHEGFPVLRWEEASDWVKPLSDEEAGKAWFACAQGWVLHLRDALGAGYRLDSAPGVSLLSSLDHQAATAALEFMQRTQRRVVHVLKGIAKAPEWGDELLILFDDHDGYYRYVSRFYPDAGEFAFSGGMHVNDGGTSYYIARKGDLRAIEPTIAHEMTHGCVGHLPLPLWLNEGLAVNTEHRLAGAGMPIYAPTEMHAKHLKFWAPETIQDFWSGDSFGRPDEGNMLSYDLARVLVENLSADWARFAEFAQAAHWRDAGAEAAREHLGIDLGATAAAIFERDDAGWAPAPEGWKHLQTKTE